LLKVITTIPAQNGLERPGAIGDGYVYWALNFVESLNTDSVKNIKQGN
jgi:hypothetical protein